MTEEFLIAKDLQKSFRDLKAVDGVSFSIEKGEIFGLLGPNGAGKTTTIRIYLRLHLPIRGISLSGVIISKKTRIKSAA